MGISDWSADVCSSDLAEPGIVGVLERDLGKLVLRDFVGRPGFPHLDPKLGRLRDGEPEVAGDDHHADLVEGAVQLDNGLGLLSTIKSEEHTSELQSLMRISYAVFCLYKTNYHSPYDYHLSLD